MKKFIVLMFVLALCGAKVKAQFNVPDSKDKSSLLNQPSSTGVELEGAKLNLDFNNISSQRTFENKWLVGVKYKGGSENGISQLFDSGDFVFGNELNGFLGFSFMTSSKEEKKWMKMLEKVDSTSSEETKKRTASARKLMNQFINSNKTELSEYQSNGLIIYMFGVPDTIDAIELSEIDLKTDDKTLETFYTAYKFITTLQKKIKELFTAINKIVEEEKKYQLSLLIIRNEYERNISSIQSKSMGKPRITVFVNGGISGHKFSLIDTLESGFIDAQKTKFCGGNIGIGANIRFNGKHYIGLLYNIDWIDNFSDLDKKTYSLVDHNTIGGKIYDVKSELTAYTGNYQKFQKHTFGIDFVNQVSFSDFSRIAINSPYIRYNAFTGLKDAKNTFDLGVSINFYQTTSKFLFGLFTELDDVTNENKTDRVAIKRLTFGFRVNYALFTVLGN